MDTQKKFSQQCYVVERNFIGKELAEALATQFKLHRDTCMLKTNNNKSQFYDMLVTDNCFAWYAPVDHLLLTLTSKMEKITGEKLIPTYSFGRVYYKNAEMMRHVDRRACEISATLCVSITDAPWPIWLSTKDNIDIPVDLYPGDALVYQGQIVPHWRNPYIEGTEQVQFFLHWVRATGNNVDQKFDRREMLGLPPIPTTEGDY